MAQTIGNQKIDNVGVEIVDGYSQIYYEDADGKHFITSGNANSRTLSWVGDFIAYVTEIQGEGKIFLYDNKSGSKIQLTIAGNSQNPKVNSKGQVTWEGWTEDTWQVFFFDGTSTQQLTVGDTTLNPDFGGEYISYGRRNSAGTWRAVIYSITDKKSVDVTTGETARKPKIDKDGNILLGDGAEKFSLKASDLFLLDLSSVEESTPSADPILEELSATPSGVMEMSVSTESGNL